MGDRYCRGQVAGVVRSVFGNRQERDDDRRDHHRGADKSYGDYGKFTTYSSGHRGSESSHVSPRTCRQAIARAVVSQQQQRSCAPASSSSASQINHVTQSNSVTQGNSVTQHTGWVTLDGGVRARLNNGRIEAEIPTTKEQSQGQITYNFNRSDGTKSAVSTVNLKNIQQHITYSNDLKIDEAKSSSGSDYLKVTALHKGVKDVHITVKGSDGKETRYVITQSGIQEALDKKNQSARAAEINPKAARPADTKTTTTKPPSAPTSSAPAQASPPPPPPTTTTTTTPASSSSSSPQTTSAAADPAQSKAAANKTFVQKAVDEQTNSGAANQTRPTATRLIHVAGRNNSPDLEKNPATGLKHPAVVFTPDNQSGALQFYSILRAVTSTNSAPTPALLQVVNIADRSQSLNSFVFRAYEACFGKDGTSFFNQRTQLNNSITIAGKNYTHAEVRSDGNVALYPQDHQDNKPFKYLVFTGEAKSANSDQSPWKMIDAEKQEDGSIKRVEIPAEITASAQALFDALKVVLQESYYDPDGVNHGYRTDYNMIDFDGAKEIIANSRAAGTLEQLNSAFKELSNGTPIQSYYYQQTAQAGITPESAISGFEDPRIARGTIAIFREANGATNDTTLTNLIGAYNQDEIAAIEKVYNAAYARVGEQSFRDMLNYEQVELAGIIAENTSTPSTASFDIHYQLNILQNSLTIQTPAYLPFIDSALDSQEELAATLSNLSSLSPNPSLISTFATPNYMGSGVLSGSIFYLSDETKVAQIMKQARATGNLEALSEAYAKQTNRSSLDDYIYDQAKKTNSTKRAIAWVEGPGVARGVEAIYHEAKGLGTNSQTLVDLLNAYRPDLVKIRAAWNRAYQDDYGQDFDTMLINVLGTARAKPYQTEESSTAPKKP